MGSRKSEKNGTRLWEAGVMHAGYDEAERTSEYRCFHRKSLFRLRTVYNRE